MTHSDFKSTITMASLRGSDLKGFFALAFDPTVDFVVTSASMSLIDGDKAPEGTSVKSFVRNYYLGANAPLSVEVTDSLLDGLNDIDAFDLLSRSGQLKDREDWTIARLETLINNPRVFAVSARLGHTQVTDCFLELHSREWFGPLADLIDAYANSPLEYGPYAVSEEYSAKKIGPNFFLHQGTNNWNRSWLPTARWSEHWDSHLLGWKSQISDAMKLAKTLKAKQYQFLFVPEKDTLARTSDPGLFQSGLLPMLSLMELIDHAAPETVLFPVKDLIQNVETRTRLTMADSHLCAEDYWIIFYRVMERFGLESKLNVAVRCEYGELHADLGSKFGLEKNMRQVIEFDLPDAELTYGDAELQVPLRNNHVVFTNSAAPVRRSLLILGDSHSSIGMNPMLTYIARHFFETVEFAWSPFNVHGYKKSYFKSAQYDHILFETSQRFATPKTVQE